MESAACVDCGWHAAVVAGVAAAAAAGGDSSGSGADCGAVAAEAIVVVAVVASGAIRVSDCHYGLGTVAFAAGILGWKRKTSATLAKGAAVAAVVVAGHCRL